MVLLAANASTLEGDLYDGVDDFTLTDMLQCRFKEPALPIRIDVRDDDDEARME